MNYREALAWLYSTQLHGIKLGLENIQRLLDALNISLEKARVIHVAGTNGKGSVCVFADSICRAAGYRSGLFTSPHLVSFRERIRVNGEMIGENHVAGGLTRIKQLIANWQPHPTFFEITTALALHYFYEQKCDVVILETGMGGRLDATNAVSSVVAVITPIDFDHEKWLGHSLVEIAREKAGIIKRGVPVVSAPQREEVEIVLRQRAGECGAPLNFVNEKWTKSDPGLAGEYQRMNAAIAVASVRAARIELTDAAITRGLATIEWPARFQIVGAATPPSQTDHTGHEGVPTPAFAAPIIVDGAHNPAAARLLAQTWREEFGHDLTTIVLAILRDKNAAEIIAALHPIAARFILPKIRSERAVEPEQLAQVIRKNRGRLNQSPLPSSIVSSTMEALDAAKNFPERILITGSLHFAGEALAVLRGESDALEECAQ